MTQVTGYTMSDAKVEYSANGSSWTDISGAAAAVSDTTQERATGNVNTHDTDNPIVTFGKLAPVAPRFRIVYSEGTGDPFEVIRAAFEASTSCYFRWSPRGGSAGQAQFATGAGKITSFKYPDSDSGSGAPVMCEFVHVSPDITKSTVST